MYGTTDKFLRVFGLTTLEDLPKTEIKLPETKPGEQLSIAPEEMATQGEEETTKE